MNFPPSQRNLLIMQHAAEPGKLQIQRFAKSNEMKKLMLKKSFSHSQDQAIEPRIKENRLVKDARFFKNCEII